ncbi:GxxExxY protein [Pollutibacter soli]|uniref:GxxExxY protein n=1 Tax=Pollutibacter soli TaxID=3034157 RepID=UPI003013F354
MITKKYLNDLTYKVIGCAIEVHKTIGPALVESVYEKLMLHEMRLKGLKCESQVSAAIHYKGVEIQTDLRLDILVEDVLCLELKAQQGLLPVHDAITLSYMEMLQKPKGLLINFQCVNIVREGQKTFVNRLFAALPDE